MNTLSESTKRLAVLAGLPVPTTLNEMTVDEYMVTKTKELLPAIQKAYNELGDALKKRMSFGEFVKHAMDGVQQGAADEIATMMKKIQVNANPAREVSQQKPVPGEEQKPLGLEPIAKKMELVPKENHPREPIQRIRSNVAPRNLPSVRSGGERFKRFLSRQVGRVGKMTGPGGV